MTTEHKLVSNIAIKRKITEAGRIKDAIATQVKRLTALEKEIRTYMAEGLEPYEGLTLVSGEYVANLTTETQTRSITDSVKAEIYADVGHQRYLEMSTLPLGVLSKEFSEKELDRYAPKQWSGGGRRFSLTQKK